MEGPQADVKVIVVIPSYDEAPEATLKSLGKNVVDEFTVEVILVLNHSENEEQRVRDLHIKQAEQFQNFVLQNGVVVRVIKAFDLPVKHAGVGLARKIGMDIALQRFSEIDHDGLIVCFDADSTVSNNYLAELLLAESKNVSGLSIAFEHPIESIKDEKVKFRISNYENWLRYYIQALRFIGYPHAFHTIGSSMAARASVYAKVGGMNRKKAGEDFYFLHKLIPQGEFYDLTTCTVYPSPRISTRVPFGTGRAMLEMEAGEKDFSEVYNPEIFQLLKSWFNNIDAIENLNTGQWPQFIKEAFERFAWLKPLKELKHRSTSAKSFRRNFFFWLDGFKMLKLVHFARDNYFINVEACKASEVLLNIKADSSQQLLAELRKRERESAFTYF